MEGKGKAPADRSGLDHTFDDIDDEIDTGERTGGSKICELISKPSAQEKQVHAKTADTSTAEVPSADPSNADLFSAKVQTADAADPSPTADQSSAELATEATAQAAAPQVANSSIVLSFIQSSGDSSP